MCYKRPMARELSAGGVLVRRLRGRWWLAAIRPQGKPEGVWALPKGLIDAGESAAATACARSPRRPGLDGRLEGKLGDVRYVYSRRGGERVFKVVSFFLLRYRRGRIGELPPGMERRGRRGALAPARRRAAAPRLPRRARHGRGGDRGARRARSMMGAAVAMFALNFYSPLVADQLRTHRKTATIRLGDKSGKYKKGMIVTVLVGVRYGQREKIFDAVIDKVEVKQIRDLSPREIEHDNPEIRRPDEMTRFLGQLYNREISEDDMVTVIRFSQIIGSMF